MTVLHSALTGANLHEPKGCAAATSGYVYVANGAGSGSWTIKLPTMASKSAFLLTNNGTVESWSSDSTVRARASFTGVSTPVVSSGAVNISTITRTATGRYTVTFTTNLASSNYQVVGNSDASGYSGQAGFSIGSKTVSGFTIAIAVAATGYVNADTVDFVVFGGF